VAITHIETDDDLSQVWAEPLAVIYKHSPICHRSVTSRVEVDRFSTEHPEIPVFQIDVIAQRSVSNLVAERFGIRHESPQAFVVRDGSPTWYGSHQNVTAQHLETNLDNESPPSLSE